MKVIGLIRKEKEKRNKISHHPVLTTNHLEMRRDAIESKSPLPFYVVRKGKYFDTIEKTAISKGRGE